MGIIYKKNISLQEKQVSDFLFSQSFWGHKKQFLKPSLNKHILGLKNNFAIFNCEHFLEYSNRCGFFCFNTVLLGGTVLFVSTNNYYKKLTLFFAIRCFQHSYTNKWLGGLITNDLIKSNEFDILVASKLNYDSYVIKETYRKLIPVISIEDSDHPLNKSLYSTFANDDRIDSTYMLYKLLTDFVIKSLLFKHCKKLYP